MSMTKNYWHDEISKTRRQNAVLANILGISEEDLDQLTYDIDEHRSKDGMLYNYFITFYGENDPDILKRIKGLEKGDYVTLDPWDLDSDRNYDDYYEEELRWQIAHSDQLERFSKNMEAVYHLIRMSIDNDLRFNFLVMSHAYVVATFENFLSSTFSHHVMNSKKLIGKLLIADDVLSKKKYTLKDIYDESNGVESVVLSHLNDMSFHNIERVRELFKKVLSFQFVEIDWLINAVNIRHDCVHRAGYKQDGEAVSITIEGINELMKRCEELAEKIDAHMRNLDELDNCNDLGKTENQKVIKNNQDFEDLFK